MFAGHHRFETDYRSCPRHQQVACPQDLQAARGLKADELSVSWQPIDHANLLDGAAVTVIVEAGDAAAVGTAPVAATRAPFAALPRNSELDIAVALTRQGHVISEVCRLRLRSTQTRTGPRTRDTTPRAASVAVTPPTVPVPIPTTPPTTPSLAAVNGLAVNAPGTDAHASRDLTWTAPASTTEIANFEIEHCSDAACGGTPTTAGTPSNTATAHTVTGLTRNTAYHFRIRAVAASGSGYTDSAWPPTVPGTTAREPLPALSNVRGYTTGILGDQAGIQWDALTHAALQSYRVEHCANSQCSGAATAAQNITDLSVTHSQYFQCAGGSTCYFRVKARTTTSGYIDGPWSDIIEQTGHVGG